jgi:hypothetical protein
MDSIIQRLLQQQQKNHGTDEAAKKPQREWQPFSEGYIQEDEEDVPEPFDNDASHLQYHNRTRTAGAPCIIAGHGAKQDVEDPDKVIEKKPQRKKLDTPDSDNQRAAWRSSGWSPGEAPNSGNLEGSSSSNLHDQYRGEYH